MIVDVLKKIIDFFGIRKYILKILIGYGRMFPDKIISRGGGLNIVLISQRRLISIYFLVVGSQKH